MPRYKRDEIEYFCQVEASYLERFEQLDAKTQQQIIDGLRQVADDPKVSKQDRDIAQSRANQLSNVAK